MNYLEVKRLLDYYENLTPVEREKYLKEQRDKTGIAIEDLARAWQTSKEKIQELSSHQGYVQIDEVSSVRCEILGLDYKKTMPGFTFEECSRLYCVSVEKVYEIFMGITLWIDKAGNKIIPVSDVLRGYSYFYPRTIKKQR